MFSVPKAPASDFLGRFREIVSDPLNLLIERHPLAGYVDGGYVYLHNGLKVAANGKHAYYENFSDILVINRGVHEPIEEYAFQELLARLPESPRMLELGAYWGHYSMWLKLIRPEAKVHLVEPDEANLEVGKKNFETNGFTGSFELAFVGTGKFTVDDYFKRDGIGHLDVLHSDIQGYELEMLAGCSEALQQRRIDYVFISTHWQTLHQQVVARLREHGYRVEISSDFDHETTSFDGFVFASSPEKAPVFQGFAPLSRREIAAATPKERVSFLAGLNDRL